MKILNYPSSGSYQGLTFSRNRNGQYVRNRAIPVNPASTFQQAVRSRLSLNAQSYRDLTAAQRSGWNDLGLQIQRTDTLGQTYTLSGFQAYCMINNNRLAAGDAVLTDAGALLPPDPLATLTPTITTSTYSVAYTVTPAPAGQRVFISASPQRSAGRTFEGDFRLIAVTAAAAASPSSIFTAYQARFGSPVTGSRIFTSAQMYLGGFLSTPLITSTVVP
jgi:hypothetical protein